MDDLLQDLRFASRILAKSPLFAIVAILTLGLGIGANAAIFSVVDTVLLKPFPYPEPDRLANLWEDNLVMGWHEDVTSYPAFQDWRSSNTAFESMSAFTQGTFNITGRQEPMEIRAAHASADYFRVLGIDAEKGRTFTEDEDAPSKDPVVILSHALSQKLFGSGQAALGQTLTFDRRPYSVIGVMPAGFAHPTDTTAAWTQLNPSQRMRQERGAKWLRVIGRLKPDISFETARSDMSRVADTLVEQYPQKQANLGVTVIPFHEQEVRESRPALIFLLAAVGFVLLIACANVANLLLSRASGREREIAVRSAIGARGGRLVRQLLTEGMLLSVLSSAVGIALAVFSLRLVPLLQPEGIPRLEEASIDPRVLGFALLLSLLTGLIFSSVPAWTLLRRSTLGAGLKEGGRGDTGSSGRLRSVLVVVEVALALALLVGAGLMVRSFKHLLDVDPGFQAEGLMRAGVNLPNSKYDSQEKIRGFYTAAKERLRALPGVIEVAVVRSMPFASGYESAIFSIQGEPELPVEERVEVKSNRADEDYFSALGARIVSGRTFEPKDSAGSPYVVVVNQEMVRRHFQGADPIGRQFKWGRLDEQSPFFEVIGVVADMRYRSLAEPPDPEVFMSINQAVTRRIHFAIRTGSDSAGLVKPIQAAIWEIDPDLPLSGIEPMSELIGRSLGQRRFQLFVLGIFSGLALLLSAIGIYGVLSYGVSRRIREIGVRIALGAGRSDVLGLVKGRGLALTCLGIAVGIGASLAATRLISDQLYGVASTDPLTIAAVAALLLGIAALACLIPAWRATRVDPLSALRCD